MQFVITNQKNKNGNTWIKKKQPNSRKSFLMFFPADSIKRYFTKLKTNPFFAFLSHNMTWKTNVTFLKKKQHCVHHLMGTRTIHSCVLTKNLNNAFILCRTATETWLLVSFFVFFYVIFTNQTLELVWGVHLTQSRKLHTVPRELVGVWPVPLSQAVPLPVSAKELGVPQAAARGRAARLLPGALPGSRAQRSLQPRQQRPLLVRPPRAASQAEVSHAAASAGQITHKDQTTAVWCEVTWPERRTNRDLTRPRAGR